MKTESTNKAAAATIIAAAAPVTSEVKNGKSKSTKTAKQTAAPIEDVPSGAETFGFLLDLFLSTYQTDKKKAEKIAKQALDGDLNLEQRKAVMTHMGAKDEPTFANVMKEALKLFKKQENEKKAAPAATTIAITLPEGVTSKRGYANKGLTYVKHGSSHTTWDAPKMKAGDPVGFKVKGGEEQVGTLGWVHSCREGHFAHIRIEGSKKVVVRSIKTIIVPPNPVAAKPAPAATTKQKKAK